jgi:putative phosphotransacetylase
LSQPGQYACEEMVALVWPKGKIERVRILGPLRKETQVEISISDAFALGVQPVIRISGDLPWTPGIKLVSPTWEFDLERGVIVAQRHIHMTTAEAAQWDIKDEQVVSVKTNWPRGLTFDNVSVRVRDDYALDCHIDIEEANASWLKNGERWEILK